MSQEPLTTEQQYLVSTSTSRLHDQYAHVAGRETIERLIRESLVHLNNSSVTKWLPVLAERFAADQLRALAKLDNLLDTDRPHVLFLCVQNAGRSQMAAAWTTHLSGGGVEVFSGGSEPASQVNPAAVAAMQEVGIDIAAAYPKPWTDDIVRAADVVITMGCGDACPIFPGKRYEDWVITDPAGKDVEAIRPIRDEIKARVETLLADLRTRTPA